MSSSRKIAALLVFASLQNGCTDYVTRADPPLVYGRLVTDDQPEVGRELVLFEEDDQACDIHGHSQPGSSNISDSNGKFYVWPHSPQRLPEKAAQGQTLCLLVENRWYPIWHSDKHVEYGTLLCDRTALSPWSCTVTEMTRQLNVPTTAEPHPTPTPSSKP